MKDDGVADGHPDLTETPDLSEPLADLARFAFETARRTCRSDHSCAAYHRSWSMIRLLTKAGALPEGQAFLAPRLASVAVAGRCRVLLSGAADTGLAALVLQTAQSVGVRADIVLADRCATTLAQNRRYGDAIGQRFELYQTDLADLTCPPVDLVLAHSVLNFLPAAARAGLARAWARVLRGGGALVGVQRFGGAGRDRDPLRIAGDAVQLEAAALAHGLDPALAAEVGTAGNAFWTVKLTHAPMAAADCAALLQAVGFDAIEMVAQDAPAHASPMAGSARPLAEKRVFFAARKPVFAAGTDQSSAMDQDPATNQVQAASKVASVEGGSRMIAT